jgi:hypothetical protein
VYRPFFNQLEGRKPQNGVLKRAWKEGRTENIGKKATYEVEGRKVKEGMKVPPPGRFSFFLSFFLSSHPFSSHLLSERVYMRKEEG